MIKLAAEPRTLFGKQTKALRQAGKLPVVAYGHHEPPLALTVSAAEFGNVWKQAGESTVIALAIGGEEKEALIHEVAYHPVSGEPIHTDFYLIEKGKVLQVPVRLEFVGASEAVKSLGGILVKVLHQLEVEALPKDLPGHLEVDISQLANLESQILVRDLKLPSGVKPLAGPEEVVASIATVQEEKEEAPIDLSQIEVEKKGKVEPEAGAEPETEPAPEKKKS